jgi:hypothetical protein
MTETCPPDEIARDTDVPAGTPDDLVARARRTVYEDAHRKHAALKVGIENARSGVVALGNCLTCRYWHPMTYLADDPSDIWDAPGECRRHAPQPVLDCDVQSYHWPRTTAVEGCGEFA